MSHLQPPAAAAHGYLSGRSWPNTETPLVFAKCWIVAAALVYLYDIWGQTADGLTNGLGRPFGDDFINYWSAAKLALLGRVNEVYDLYAFNTFQESVVGADVRYDNSNAGINFYHYSYPPVLILFTLPLALVPYVPALFLWLGVSWYVFYHTLRRVMPSGALLLALAMPAVFINAMAGQNAYWSATLLGGGLYLLDRRPAIAGIMFGLLIYKPHLGILIPIALIAGRKWRALTAGAVTVIATMVASAVAFGPEIWSDYLRNTAFLRSVVLDDGSGVFHRMVSVFFAARRLGADVELAYAVQAVSTISAAAVVGYAWARGAPAYLRYSLLILGTWLATPYLLDYDLVASAFAAAWLCSRYGTGDRLDPRTLAVFALIMIAPMTSVTIGKPLGLSMGAFFLVPAFILTAGRLRWRGLRFTSAHT